MSAHLAELEVKIADLQQMRASLAALVDTCHRPRADRSCPLLTTGLATYRSTRARHEA
jgi:hypothetical protein